MTESTLEKLKELNDRLSDPELDPDLALQLFDNAPDGIIIIDSVGVMRFVNRQALLMFGYAHRDLIGQAIEMLLPEEMRERHVEHRKAYHDDPRIRPMGLDILEIKGLTKDGRTFNADVNLCPLVSTHGNFYGAYIRKKRK